MPAGSFVDTNIWVYAHLKAPGEPRHPRALAFARQLKNGIISPQVVAEYYSVMLRNGKDDTWIQTNLAAIFGYTQLQPLKAISGKDYTGKSGVGGSGFPSLDKEGWRGAPGWFDRVGIARSLPWPWKPVASPCVPKTCRQDKSSITYWPW